MDKIFSKMFPWSFCVWAVAALLLMIIYSYGHAKTPRLNAEPVAGAFTAPLFVTTHDGDTSRICDVETQ